MNFILKVLRVYQVPNEDIQVLFLEGVIYDRYRKIIVEANKSLQITKRNYLLIDSNKWTFRSLDESFTSKHGVEYEIVSNHIPGYIETHKSQLEGNTLELIEASKNNITLVDFLQTIDDHADSI